MIKNILNAALISILIFLTSDVTYSYDFNVASDTSSSTIQKLSQKENKTADDYLTLGWAYYAFKNDVNEGAANFEKAIEKNAGFYEANLLLGLLYKSKGEYEKALQHWLKCFDFDREENTTLIYYVRDLEFSLADVRKIIEKYEHIIGSSKDELIKAHASYCLGYYYGVLGNAAKAKEAYQKLGYIKDWIVIGPFDNKEKVGFNAVYSPETEIDLTKQYDGKSIKVGWRKLIGLDLAQTVNFNSVFYPNEWATGYALIYVLSDSDKDVAMRVGSDDSIKVWLNDELIIQNEKYQAFLPDQNETGAILHKGWNKLLVKVCQGGGDWKFGLRITDVNGRPIELLSYSCEPKPYTSETGRIASSGKVPTIRTIKNIFKERMNKNPTDYVDAYMLAKWLHFLDLRKESLDEFESLVQKEPHCAIFRFGLADAESSYGNNEKALANYKETIVEDPNHVEGLMKMAQHFYDNKMNDQALEYMKKAEKISPDYIDTYLLTSSIYSDNKWSKDAYDKAKAGLAKYPESTQMLYRMASCAADIFKVNEEMECYEKLMQWNTWYRPDYYQDFVELCASRGELSKIEEIYNKRVDFYTFNSFFYNELAYIAWKARQYQKAIEYCDRGLEISPDNRGFYVKKGLNYYFLGKKEEALREWEKGLKLDPSYTWLRDMVKFAKGEEKTILNQYAESEESIKDLLEVNDISKRYPLADAAYLLDENVIDLHDDGSSEVLTHFIIKIMTKEGVDKFTTVDLPWGKTIEIEKAVVRNPGKTDTEISEIDFNKRKFYPAGLNVGSIIDFKCKADISSGMLKGHYYGLFFFNRLFPIYRENVVVIAPKGKELKINKEDEGIQYKTELVDDKIVHVWQGTYRDPVKIEPYMPPIRNFFSSIAISDIPSWDYLADWENNLIDDQLEIDPSIKAQIDQLTEDKKTQEEKLIAIYSYLGRNIHYLALKHEVFGWKPNRATKIFKDGYGDCKDMAILMIAMLKSIGVDSHLTILGTRPYYEMIAALPIPIANHAIVYVPELDGRKRGLFVDVTAASAYDCLTTPYWDEGMTAIILKRPGYEIVRIPVSKAENNIEYTKVDTALSKDGMMKFNLEIDLRGQCAGFMRSIACSDNWDTTFSTLLGKYIQAITLLKNWTDNKSDSSKPFVVHAEFSAPTLLKKSENMKYEVAPILPLQSIQEYASLESRKNDLSLFYAYTSIVEEELKVPEDLEVVSMPEGKRIDNELIYYESTYGFKDNVLRSKRSLSIKKELIKKEEYPAFRNNFIEIDKLDERRVILRSK